VPLSPMLGLAVMVAAAFMALVGGMARETLASALPGAAAAVFAIPYCALTLGALVLLRDLHWGPWWLLYLFVVVWSGDIFAYYVCRAIGRHKLAPRISPGKSWEGAAASFVGSMVCGALMFMFQPEITNALANVHAMARGSLGGPPVWQGIVLAGTLNVVAQLGDLVESMIKRGAGVKDSGTL